MAVVMRLPKPKIMPRTLLIDAVKAADRAAALRRIGAGDDVNQRDELGRTALLYAAERGDADWVAWLLDRGAAIDAAQYPPDHGTAVEFAIAGGHAAVAELLLAGGARATGSMLNFAATQGQLAIVDALLDRGAPVVASAGGGTALLSLCGFGPQHARPLPREPVCRTVVRLIAAGADVNGRDAQRETPLLAAIRSDNVPVVELLLAKGARADVPDGPMPVLTQARNSAMVERLLRAGIAEPARRAAFWHYVHYGRRDLAPLLARTLPSPEVGPLLAGLALLDAFRRGDATTGGQRLAAASESGVPAQFGEIALVEAVQAHRVEDRRRLPDLLLGAGVNVNTSYLGRTPLVGAVLVKDKTLVRRLLAAGADPNCRPERGDTALMAAVGSGDFWNERVGAAPRFEPAMDEMVQVLLAAGADVNARGHEGRTALMYAIHRYPHNLGCLLEAGADVNLATDEGWGPLMNADERVTRLLLDAGADANARTRGGQTPLHVCTSLATARLLVARGADPNGRNQAGATPLWAHAMAGRSEILRWLVPQTADFDGANADGTPALLIAALLGHEEDVLFLVAHGAKVAGQNKHGVNVLIAASRNGKPRLARLALEHGVPVDNQDYEGGTAMMSAASFGHEEIVRLLLARGANVGLRDKLGRTALQLALLFGRKETAALLREDGAD
ncbi:MAG: hypothetical protein EXS37_02545 [Opitutus sp.]|nr:hypothetical protein [Opitutus sp.]